MRGAPPCMAVLFEFKKQFFAYKVNENVMQIKQLMSLQATGNPREVPKPGEQPEIPGKDVPDAPVLPPDKPEVIPEEKPETGRPPSEIPKPR